MIKNPDLSFSPISDAQYTIEIDESNNEYKMYFSKCVAGTQAYGEDNDCDGLPFDSTTKIVFFAEIDGDVSTKK